MIVEKPLIIEMNSPNVLQNLFAAGVPPWLRLLALSQPTPHISRCTTLIPARSPRADAGGFQGNGRDVASAAAEYRF
jgi:hypothetical protein